MGILNNPAAGVSPGDIVASPLSTKPGYLLCNGATVSRTAYAALFKAIGTTYGTGDGSTTFKIPDFRGDFLRGYLSGTSAAIGTRQAEGLPNITGTLGGGKTIWNNPTASGAFSVATYSEAWGGAGAGTITTIDNLYFNASRSNGLYGDSSHVTPRNNAINYFIKY